CARSRITTLVEPWYFDVW
nr:immunoglobulin heavy chain junction region [Mus musculus]MBK4195447.1 immunoglobulin heavy chain junction region [Mus musculus]MBK4195448.1 immunoglobulin heavy chain junction region [Mus musculus]